MMMKQTSRGQLTSQLANVKEALNSISKPAAAAIGTPSKLVEFLESQDQRLAASKNSLTNTDAKNVRKDFLQRQAESIENVKSNTRNVGRSHRTDFS